MIAIDEGVKNLQSEQHIWSLPEDFEISNHSQALIVNCFLDLDDSNAIDATGIANYRQSLRNKI